MNTEKRTFVISLFMFLSISLFVNCDRDFGTYPGNHEYYNLNYTITGGFQGMHKVLEISATHNVTYQDYSFSVSNTINKNRLKELYNLLIENDFFQLDSLYTPEQRLMDDVISTITFQSSGISNTVTVSSYYLHISKDAVWADKVKNIRQYLNDYITTLTTDINTGKVTIRSKSILQEWPFSDKLSLAENLSKHVNADEDVYNFLTEQYYRNTKTTIFEGDYVYHMNGSGGYGGTYSELDTFYVSIHTRNKAIFWPFEMKLSNITDEGYILTGQDYLWLRDTLEAIYYPKFFYETSIKTGEYVYELSLLKGNNF